MPHFMSKNSTETRFLDSKYEWEDYHHSSYVSVECRKYIQYLYFYLD